MCAFGKRLLIPSLAIGLTSVLLSGCGSGSQETSAVDTPAPKVQEPVTIKVASVNGWFTDEQFKQYVADPVKKKFPHISVEMIPYIYGESSASNPTLTNLTKIVASGVIPDIVVTSSLTASDLINLGLEYDMDALIKKHKLDLGMFESGIIDAVRMASSDGKKLTMLPYERNFSVIYYNKGIFDKFAVAYPPDGMTWDETRELARKLTKEEGGVQYRGLEPNLVFRAASALSLGFVDPATKKPTVNNDSWKRVFTTLKSIYDIPGNSGFQLAGTATNAFTKNRSLAMYAGLSGDLEALGSAADLNWDMATYPSFDKNKLISFNFDAHVMAVTAGSKHLDEAFNVVASLLSKEVQTLMSQNGSLPVLKDEAVIKAFGTNLPYLKGKHVEAIFKTTPAKPPAATIYDADAKTILNQTMQSVAKGEMDVNTALRTAEEKIDQLVKTK
jgi:multiple sugar transport system substrate-binding protein